MKTLKILALAIQHHKMMTMSKQSSMMNIWKNNPGMMQSRMAAMMETAKGDSMNALKLLQG